MEIDFKEIKILEQYLMPHIALTTYKYRAKALALFKSKKIDITIDQFMILRMLVVYHEMTQQDMAEALYKDKSNLSRMIEVLEKKGYITRKPDMKGKMVVKILSITKKGEKHAQKITAIAEQIGRMAMNGISEEEFIALKKITGKIRDNLNEEFEVD